MNRPLSDVHNVHNDGDCVVTQRRGPAEWITLNRPSAANAINRAIIERLDTIIDQASRDRDLRAIVLTGAGGNFCAGADVVENGQLLSTGAVDAVQDSLERMAGIVDRIADLRVPVIAAVDGVAFAGGFELVLASDIVIASTRARFADGHVAHGFVPGWGSTARAPIKLGAAMASRLLIGGETVGAGELPMLVAAVVEPDDLDERVTAAVERIAATGPTAVAAVKTLLAERPGRTHDEAMLAEREALRAQLNSAELAEGVAAFQEHRPPTFSS